MRIIKHKANAAIQHLPRLPENMFSIAFPISPHPKSDRLLAQTREHFLCLLDHDLLLIHGHLLFPHDLSQQSDQIHGSDALAAFDGNQIRRFFGDEAPVLFAFDSTRSLLATRIRRGLEVFALLVSNASAPKSRAF